MSILFLELLSQLKTAVTIQWSPSPQWGQNCRAGDCRWVAAVSSPAHHVLSQCRKFLITVYMGPDDCGSVCPPTVITITSSFAIIDITDSLAQALKLANYHLLLWDHSLHLQSVTKIRLI